MEKIFNITEGWDKRNPDPEKNYGIHGGELRMVLKGELGAVQFLLLLTKHSEKVIKELYSQNIVSQVEELVFGGIEEKLLSWAEPFTKGKEIEEIRTYQAWLNTVEFDKKFLFSPIAADLGYHSPVPMYESHEKIGAVKYDYKDLDKNGLPKSIPVPEDKIPICEYLGTHCYYDGSGLAAEDVYQLLLAGGEQAVWGRLEDYYINTFGELK